jgi:hypothetical protein
MFMDKDNNPYFGEMIPGDREATVEEIAAWEASRTPTLEGLKADAQSRIDAYFQHLFDLAVPNSAMKAEYDAAYMVAKRWLENQGEPAPERVKALAESYGVTNVLAAQVVVTKWTEAQAVAFDLRGAARLRAKLAIRQAVDAEGVAAAELAGRAAMEAVVYSV